MKTRYVFPVYPGVPFLNTYSVLEARIGSLRILVPSSGSHALHLLAIIAVGLGYPLLLVLIASTPYYQQSAPWQIPGFTTILPILFVGGFFALLLWEERSMPTWTIRLTSLSPRRHKQVQPIAIRPGLIFQELYAKIDNEEVLLRIEGSHRRVLNALTLARISVPERPTRRGTLSTPESGSGKILLGPLARLLTQTSINIAALALLPFFGGFFAFYVWFLLQDPYNLLWILSTLLFGWLTAVIVQAILRGRRFYCYKCDGYELFFRRHGEWKCQTCGEATAV